MFGFLKEKIKNAISKLKKTVEDSPDVNGSDIKEKPEQKSEHKIEHKPEHKIEPKSNSKSEKSETKKDTKKEHEKKLKITEKLKEETKEEIKKEIKLSKEPLVKEKKSKEHSKLKEEVEHEKPILNTSPKKKSFFSKIAQTFTGKKDDVKLKDDVKSKTEKIETKTSEINLPETKTLEIKKEIPIKDEKLNKQTVGEKKAEEKAEDAIENIPKEKKGFFEKLSEAVTTKSLSDEKFEEIFWELEIGLMESNVAMEVIEKIKSDLKKELVNTKLKIGKTEEVIISTLKKSIEELFEIDNIDIFKAIQSRKEESKNGQKNPYVICFFGVNGSGKTTTIAKIASKLKKENISCVIAAADTFRAAAIHQLEEHASRIDVKLIKHDYGADPAAVAYDAVEHAKAKGKEVVLIDTAGRQHSNANLIDEMKKIIRVVKPDLKVFVGDSLTGNDVVEQATSFDLAVGIDAIILTKTDVDEKGGAAISISYVTKKPIIFIGLGQSYEDLKPFDKNVVIKNLGLEV